MNVDGEAPVASHLRTWDLLLSLGFVQDSTVISDDPGGLSLNFGNFTLSAGHLLNKWFRPSVLLTGIMTTPRTIADVQCEMPTEVESREQGVAWVTWCLDNGATDGPFEPIIYTPWLAEGRACRYLLPWERSRVAYAGRPICVVSRDWARIALRDLTKLVAAVDNETPIFLQFDGEVLLFRCSGNVVAMPATGNSWVNRYSISAGLLQRLPKRLMRDLVEVSIYESVLTIDSYRFPGVIDEAPKDLTATGARGAGSQLTLSGFERGRGA